MKKPITKTLQRSEDCFIQFTDEELAELDIKAGDKFTCNANSDGSFLLEKYATIEIDLGDFDRETLEHLISTSIDQDISVNKVIEDILAVALEEFDKSGVENDVLHRAMDGLD